MRLLMLLLLLFLLTPFAVMLPPDEFVVHSSRYTICMRWPFMYCSDTCCVHFFHAMSLYRGKTFWIIDNFSTRIVIISIEFSLFLSLVMKASNFSSAPIYMQALYSLFIESFSLFFSGSFVSLGWKRNVWSIEKSLSIETHIIIEYRFNIFVSFHSLKNTLVFL